MRKNEIVRKLSKSLLTFSTYLLEIGPKKRSEKYEVYSHALRTFFADKENIKLSYVQSHK